MTYIDHHAGPERDVVSATVTHSWRAFTDARLRWLYGDGHSVERRAATTADIAAWNRLGKGRAAA